MGHKAIAREAERTAMDEELFMQELEEDDELRTNVNLFKDDSVDVGQRNTAGGETDDDDDDVPEVPIESLLDGLSLMRGTAVTEEQEYSEDDQDEDHEMMED